MSCVVFKLVPLRLAAASEEVKNNSQPGVSFSLNSNILEGFVNVSPVRLGFNFFMLMGGFTLQTHLEQKSRKNNLICKKALAGGVF